MAKDEEEKPKEEIVIYLDEGINADWLRIVRRRREEREQREREERERQEREKRKMSSES